MANKIYKCSLVLRPDFGGGSYQHFGSRLLCRGMLVKWCRQQGWPAPGDKIVLYFQEDPKDGNVLVSKRDGRLWLLSVDGEMVDVISVSLQSLLTSLNLLDKPLTAWLEY